MSKCIHIYMLICHIFQQDFPSVNRKIMLTKLFFFIVETPSLFLGWGDPPIFLAPNKVLWIKKKEIHEAICFQINTNNGGGAKSVALNKSLVLKIVCKGFLFKSLLHTYKQQCQLYNIAKGGGIKIRLSYK